MGAMIAEAREAQRSEDGLVASHVVRRMDGSGAAFENCETEKAAGAAFDRSKEIRAGRLDMLAKPPELMRSDRMGKVL